MTNGTDRKIATVHSPDLQFIQYCEEEYGINRGVYNTIDKWFFNNGIQNILKRRKTIIHFLQNLEDPRQANKTNRLKFGHGGLTISLINFWEVNGQ
jgi:riboflavin kinase